VQLSKDWLTAGEVADDLRVHVSTVREWIRQKKLKAAKFGRDYRIKRVDYEEFIEKHYNVDEDSQRGGD
jgi:excisionase family DNA binding protein